jgi:hypothetical protein
MQHGVPAFRKIRRCPDIMTSIEVNLLHIF